LLNYENIQVLLGESHHDKKNEERDKLKSEKKKKLPMLSNIQPKWEYNIKSPSSTTRKIQFSKEYGVLSSEKNNSRSLLELKGKNLLILIIQV
jgi:hypothetical protein